MKNIIPVLIDFDGVIRLGDKLADGAAELFHFLNQNNIPSCIITNSTRNTSADLIKFLNDNGINSKINAMTTVDATIEYFKEKQFRVSVYCIKSILDAFADFNISKGQRINASEKLFKLLDISKFKVNVGVLESEIINVKPGMFAAVKIQSRIEHDKILVLKDALLVRDQRNLVFVTNGNLAKWHYVDIGESNDQYYEIRNGVQPGDSVIVHGNYNLAHDSKTKIINSLYACAKESLLYFIGESQPKVEKFDTGKG